MLDMYLLIYLFVCLFVYLFIYLLRKDNANSSKTKVAINELTKGH